MNFKACIEQGKLIETGDKDVNRTREIIKLAEHKLQFWRECKEKAEQYPSLFIEGHYEIIKELAMSILYADGWKAENHDCAFQYLKEQKRAKLDFEFIAQLRKLRNSIDYEGTEVAPQLWKKYEEKIRESVDILIHAQDHTQNSIGKMRAND